LTRRRDFAKTWGMQPTRFVCAIRLIFVPALIALVFPGSATATDEPSSASEASTASKADVEHDELTGREIYERYVEGRTRESFQKLRIVSRDPGGSEQLSRFGLRVQDARDENGDPTKGVRLRSRIDVSDPFDLRHTKYLIITKDPGPDDEFIYIPSARRVRRVDLSDTSFLGTDYTFGDLVVYKPDDASHTRHPDQEIDGTPVYVVETVVNESIDVPYRRSMIYVEPNHYIPLRSRSWDSDGVEVKEMTASADSIRPFGDIWIAAESTMRDLLQNTSSTLFVDELDPNPDFNRSVFTSGRLSRGN
jgi:hypothetical protein